MNTVMASAVFSKKKRALLALLAVAVVLGLNPKPARADGAEAVAAVLVGAALLYAVKDSDSYRRSKVSYHYHNGGRQPCYDRHVAHGGRYYQHNSRNDRRGYGQQYHDRRYVQVNKYYRNDYHAGQHASKGHRDNGGHKNKGYKDNGRRDKGHKDNRYRHDNRQWNTRVPIH